VYTLSARVLSHIRRHDLLTAGERVGVAVSGGIDSVALLRLLLELRSELGIVLSVVHFNHKLRGQESHRDEQYVAGLAATYQVEFCSDSEDVAHLAEKKRVSVEAAARESRYGFFRRLLSLEAPDGPEDAQNAAPFKPNASTKIDKIVTGHTLDDQAETVLMRIIRGSGLRGIGGIHPRLVVEHDEGEFSGEIIRPLLPFRRWELEEYLKEIGQDWREDSTNADHAFTRNRVRRLLLPIIEKEFNPGVAENLGELSEIARGEEEYWENEVAGWMGTAVHWVEPEWAKPPAQKAGLVHISSSAPAPDLDLEARIDGAKWLVANASVSRPWLLTEPVAVQRRVVKTIGERAGIPLEFKHIDEILRFVGEDTRTGRELSLPLGWKLKWCRDEVVFVTPDLRSSSTPRDYEYDLPLPGRLVVPELSTVIEAARIPAKAWSAYNPDELLSADSLRGQLTVRNWRAGDRFWPIHTKSPKKIKELLQERRVAQEERDLWPVVCSGGEIVWVRGFPVHTAYRAKTGNDAVRIAEIEGDES
jgi:tRNA(Ile)-lysidine synthase